MKINWWSAALLG